MSADDYLKDVRDFYEGFSQQSARAWELSQEFYREFGERQTEVFNVIAEERLASLKQLPEIETPTQLFEMGAKLEESARERLVQLHTDNNNAIEKHFSDLAALFAPTFETTFEKTKSGAKKRSKSAA